VGQVINKKWKPIMALGCFWEPTSMPVLASVVCSTNPNLCTDDRVCTMTISTDMHSDMNVLIVLKIY
jgi:hypothetical protein